MHLLIEQVLNGLQYGVTLFLLAAGLTLIFGIMGVVNLAHGSIYMFGAFVGATLATRTGSFVVAICGGALAAASLGIAIEFTIIRRLYARDHLDQVLVTFGLILCIEEGAAWIWGRTPLFAQIPAGLGGTLRLFDFTYPVYRLVVIGFGLASALGLYFLISRTRIGMLIRAGATNRELLGALGVNIALLYTLVFGLGAFLSGLAGAAIAPLVAVQTSMGEQILIVTFVVVVVGGLGSIRGAFIAAMIVGMLDTLARGYIPLALKGLFSASVADSLGAGLASIAIYVFMALVLIRKPQGLFPLEQR